MDSIEIKEKIKIAQINNALGVFMVAFGIIVLFAMLFTETFIQHVTDMVAGLLLIGIGGGMMWRSKKSLKKLKNKSD